VGPAYQSLVQNTSLASLEALRPADSEPLHRLRLQIKASSHVAHADLAKEVDEATHQEKKVKPHTRLVQVHRHMSFSAARGAVSFLSPRLAACLTLSTACGAIADLVDGGLAGGGANQAGGHL
jgi:thiaminase